MKDLWKQADRYPVTLLVALAYVTLFALTGLGRQDPNIHPLATFGWLTPLAAANGESWRLIAAAFLHGGLVHLGFNLMMLLSVGPALEQTLGSIKYAVLYLVAALGGHIAVCLFYEIDQPVVGGSGALFGMMGCLLALNMRSGRHMFSFLDFEGPRRLVGMIVANLVIGLLIPFISNTAHVGGLLAGFVVTFVWFDTGRAPTPLLKKWRAASTALFAGLLFASIVPAARFDWLWNRGVTVGSTQGGEALLRAAAMSYYDLPSADESDVQRLMQYLEERRKKG